MIETATLPVRETAHVARPRLGFAGVGWIGRNRLEAIAASGAGEIAVIYDPVSEAATRAREVALEAEIVGSYEGLLDSDVEGVVIATPNALHARQAIAALQRGKPVFCQKPLGRNAVETRAVLDAAREADRLLHVDLSYRFTTGMQRIRELIRGGTLGRVYAVEAVFHNAYGPDKAWFYDAELSGGGCLLDLGVHLVDLVLWCLDFPEVTDAMGNLAGQPSASASFNPSGEMPALPVEHYAAAQLRLADDISVQLACSWKAPAGCDARIGITVFGSEGGAAFTNVNGSFYDFTAEHFHADRSRAVLASPPDAWCGRAAVAWCRRLAESSAFDPESENLHMVARTLDRIYGRES